MKLSPIYLPLFVAIILASNTRAQEEEGIAPVTESSGLEIISRTDRERIEMLVDVAKMYYDEGEYDQATAALRRVLEIDPKHQVASYRISHYYISAKEYGNAEKMLKSLIEEYPEDYELKNNLSWLYSTADDPAFQHGQESIKLAQEAMIDAPYDHNVWSSLAEAYYVTGKYEKAQRAISHTVSLATRNLSEKEAAQMELRYKEQVDKCRRAWESQQLLESLNKSDAEEE